MMRPARALFILALVVSTIVEVTIVRFTWPIEYGRDDRIPDRADAIVVFYGEDSRRDRALEMARDGVAPVVVLSLGQKYRTVGFVCGQTTPFTVMCPTPSMDDTESEMRMFASMIEQRSWNEVVAITNTYHKQRAQLLMKSCIKRDIPIATTTNSWRRPIGVVRDELLKYFYLRLRPVKCAPDSGIAQDL